MSAPPFYFRCQRSGNCCRVGHGRVWLEADGRCRATGHRPLSCRSRNPALLGQAQGSLENLGESLGYPWKQGEWPLLLSNRGQARRSKRGRLPQNV